VTRRAATFDGHLRQPSSGRARVIVAREPRQDRRRDRENREYHCDDATISIDDIPNSHGRDEKT